MLQDQNSSKKKSRRRPRKNPTATCKQSPADVQKEREASKLSLLVLDVAFQNATPDD